MKCAFLLVSLFSFTVVGSEVRAQEVEDVSIVRLISAPKEFHGKAVRVIGFARIEFEGNAIYLHRDDARYRIGKNGLWLALGKEVLKSHRQFDHKYVLVTGTFNANNRGHFGMFNGAIENIKIFRVWATPKRRR